MAQIVALPRTSTPDQVQLALAEHGFSRYILRDEPTATRAGYVHLKDVMDLDDAADEPFPAKRIRRLTAVSARRRPGGRLASMRRAARTSPARRPAGAITGILFLEDIIEELVGEVDDATAQH